jgi:hypothetical protein
MNLAILIGVSDYNGANDLPACKNDVALVRSILGHSDKFGDILLIEDDTASATIKSKLSGHIKTYKNGEHIEELFFYFTGHGDVFGDEFFFIPSDFDPKKKQQTGLSNGELDTMLRALSPALTIKIVDACHSGVSYIKKPDAMAKALNSSKEQFTKCYFMFSSQKFESSFQDAQLSDFTKSFAQAIVNHKGTEIRYKDIADAVADAFTTQGDQTPTFIVQADLIETFCNISSAMREEAARLLGLGIPAGVDVVGNESKGKPNAPVDIVALIKQDAQRYRSKEETLNTLQTIRDIVAKHQPAMEIGQLYERDVQALENMEIPNPVLIAKWLRHHKHEYFVELTRKTERYDDYELVPRNASNSLELAALSLQSHLGIIPYEKRKVTKTRQVLDGFVQSVQAPYSCIRIDLRPTLENLTSWTAFVVPIFSKVAVRFFYCFTPLKEKTWGIWEMPSEVAWQSDEAEMKGKAVETAVKDILSDFDRAVLTPWLDKYRSTDEQRSTDTD